MRLLSITTRFSDYLNHFYSRNPVFASQSYVKQHEALVNDAYGSFETWSEGLSRFGYQTERVFVTVPDHQKQWARDRGIPYNESNWVESILEDQIKEFQPDILIVSKQSTFSKGFVSKLRNEVSSIRMIISWCGSPYRDPSIFKEYDFILSNIPELVRDFLAQGHTCYHLNHAFDPRVLDKIDNSYQPNVNFSFIGSITKAADYHNHRETLLLELLGSTDIEIWAPVRFPSQRQRIRIRAAQLYYDTLGFALLSRVSEEQLNKILWFREIPDLNKRPDLQRYVDRRIARRAHPPVFGLSMYQKLRDSKVTLNTHIDISSESASNMRLYEATGVGTCILTDWKENLRDLFTPDEEVVTYRNSKECAEKVRYLLQNETERHVIAEAGQKRALLDNTIYQRAEQLDEIIRSHLQKTA